MSGFVFADPTEVKLETAEDAELMGAERDFQQARELFKQGKTFKAVELFSTSLEIRTKHFGKENVSLADHYRLYGDALLELVKNQADPFGGMIKQTVEEKAEKLFAEADDGEDVDDEEESGDEEGAEEGEKKEGEENPAEEKNEDANNNNDADGEGEEGDEDEGDEDDEDDEDAPPQEDPEQLLEIAWECLENARVLSEKAERWIAASDAIISLGDIALEGSQLEAAIADYQRALELRQKHLEDKNDRRIAEAHFQLALAYSLTQDGREKAREQYTLARDILQVKVAELKNKPAESTNSNANNSTQSTGAANEEVKELEQLIEELNEKIVDEGINEDEALPDLPPLPDLVPVPLSSTTGFAAPTNPSAPVNNLGVVKRKNPNARKVTPEAVTTAENKESEASRGLKRKSDEITPDTNENTDPNPAPAKKLKESAEVAAPVTPSEVTN